MMKLEYVAYLPPVIDCIIKRHKTLFACALISNYLDIFLFSSASSQSIPQTALRTHPLTCPSAYGSRRPVNVIPQRGITLLLLLPQPTGGTTQRLIGFLPSSIRTL
jgi:hypothetical protein